MITFMTTLTHGPSQALIARLDVAIIPLRGLQIVYRAIRSCTLHLNVEGRHSIMDCECAFLLADVCEIVTTLSQSQERPTQRDMQQDSTFGFACRSAMSGELRR